MGLFEPWVHQHCEIIFMGENGKDFDDLEKELPIMFDLIGIELVKWKIKNEYPTEQIPYKKHYRQQCI